eukprot:9735535-Alexandrium_andersonii.AAC.1
MLIGGLPRAVWRQHLSCYRSQSCRGCRSRKSAQPFGIGKRRTSSWRPSVNRGARAPSLWPR